MHIRDVCRKQCICTTFGVLLSVGGLLFVLFWTDIFEHMLGKEMALKPNSQSYKIWQAPPLPMHLDIYFFNWTNSEKFLNNTENPKFQEFGPYRFTEKPEKVDINWHPHNSSVSFRKKSMFFHDPIGSRRPLSDNITALNIIAISAAGRAKTWNFVKQKSVSIGLKLYEQTIAVTKTVDELLFEGYSDDMMDMAREYPIFGDDIPVIFDKFGWFYNRNNSADLTGVYTIHTGQDQIKKIGQIHSWNYKTSSDVFTSKCGEYKGSTGEFYPPRAPLNGSIQFFSAELCRTIPLDFTEKVIIHGIEGYKYSGGPRSVDNGTLYPENRCFCENSDCAPSGVMNISACRYGTPIFMSFPHFYNADPYYTNQVDGLNPSRDKHEFYMILEPLTGVVLEAAARFQINMLIEPVKNIALYEKVPYKYMPLLWFEQKVTISEEMASDLRVVLSIPTTGSICASVLIAIGILMISWLPLKRYCNSKLRRKSGKATTLGNENLEKGPEGSPLMEKNGKLTNVVFLQPSTKDILNTSDRKN